MIKNTIKQTKWTHSAWNGETWLTIAKKYYYEHFIVKKMYEELKMKKILVNIYMKIKMWHWMKSSEKIKWRHQMHKSCER